MTKHSIGRSGALLLAAAGALALAGCAGNLAIIHYSQPANAYLFDSDPTGSPHTTTSAGTGMFAFYCLNSIDNTDKNAATFNFDLSKVFVPNDPGNIPGNTSFNYLVQTAPATKSVPAHTTSGALGRIVIDVAGAGDPGSKNAFFNLSYKSSGGESVLLVRDGGNTPPPVKFLDPVSPIHPNNIPSCP